MEESEDSDKPKKETIAKAARLALSGLCGALEKEETGTIDAEFLDSLLPDEGHEVEKAIFLKFLSGDLELSKAAFENLLGRGDLEEQKINQLYELYNKTYCLVKVMKQIRELT